MNRDQAREDAYIDRIVAEAPPLTPGQIATLSALFDCDGTENRAEIRQNAGNGGTLVRTPPPRSPRL